MTARPQAQMKQAADWWLSNCSLEDLLTSPLLFGLTTASPLQRAVCRIAEGSPLGELAAHPSVLASLGGPCRLQGRPKELAVVAGIRTGKSLSAAALGVHGALTADLTVCGPGEIPRVAIVSTNKDNAKVVFDHLTGRIQASPLLRSLMVGPPRAEDLTLRRPDGRKVDVCVVAGSRAGSSLVARWMACVVFDEYARMLGDANEGVINWAESRKAVLERILPGGYLVHISSPWAPFGPAYDHVQRHWGVPSSQLVVVRATAPDMNPAYWTPERVQTAKEGDPDVYRTDVLAEFSSPEEALFHNEHLAACTRKEPRDQEPIPGASYTAAMDPATRGNGWTFVVMTRDGKTRRVAYAREWLGSRAVPLNAREVMGDIAAACRKYGVTHVDTDQWSGDALRTLAEESGITLHTWEFGQDERVERYLQMRTMFALGEMDIPDLAQMRVDLLRVRRKVNAAGATIQLPETSDGRHCDWAPTLILAVGRYLDDLPPPPKAAIDEELGRMREAAMRRYGPPTEDD